MTKIINKATTVVRHGNYHEFAVWAGRIRETFAGLGAISAEKGLIACNCQLSGKSTIKRFALLLEASSLDFSKDSLQEVAPWE